MEGLGYPSPGATSLVTLKCGSWSIPHGTTTGVGFPSISDGRNAGADSRVVKNIFPILEDPSNPNTSLAVLNVTFLATRRAIGYSLSMFSVSTMIFVLSGSNPKATKSKAFS